LQPLEDQRAVSARLAALDPPPDGLGRHSRLSGEPGLAEITHARRGPAHPLSARVRGVELRDALAERHASPPYHWSAVLRIDSPSIRARAAAASYSGPTMRRASAGSSRATA